ncbi:putative ABC transport system permease protein [Prauserella shujinwangii]|uniref:Putative ABC transport system permease protein n=1 Tax=Prauserella shujinwangii TaxID=1453103 RepID=A0A2T0LKR5_9PSEU|nr:ABC transporter permease [Prauserella shujinwangii]PRX43441.1 putative ABC transport system permease protein [Prauserella shujinwangii]
MANWGLPAPWSRAPAALWRRPAVVLATVVAGLLVALPAAAAPLFLSSSGNATLHNQIDRSCQWRVGARVEAPLSFAAPPFDRDRLTGERALDRRAEAVRAAAATVPRLSRPVVTTHLTANVVPARRPAVAPDRTTVVLMARDGFRGHVRLLAGGEGPGIWLPDGFARLQGLEPGDRVAVGTAGGAPVPMRVAAVYRDLRSLPDQPYWCGLEELYRGKPLSNQPVFPVALVDTGPLLTVAGDSEFDAGQRLEMAVDSTGLTTSGARPVVDGLTAFRDAVSRAGPAVFPGGPDITSTLGGDVARAELVVASLTGTVLPLAAAGALAGLVIAGAAGAFWADRRRTELAVLSARGVGPVAVAGKAMLETAVPVVLGGALGWVAARTLVAGSGPSPLVTPAAVGDSVLAAAAATLTALAALAVTAGVRAARVFDAPPAHRHRVLRRLPWELLPLAGAGLAWSLLDGETTTSSVGTAGMVAHLPPRLIVAPVLLTAGLALLTARLTRWALALARRRAAGDPAGAFPRHVARFLAWRRVRATPAVAAILVAATSVPVALSAFGATVIGSVERTLHAEGQLIVGTDAVFGLTGSTAVPPALGDRATVTKLWTDGDLGGTTVHVLGVDPATFGRAAFWDPALPGPDLAELLSRIGDPDAPSPGAVLAGMPVPADPVLEVRGQRRALDLTEAPQLPGKGPGYPMLLVHREVLDGLTGAARPYLWVRGDPDRSVAAVAAAGLGVSTVSRADQVHQVGVYTGITYTFAFLAAVSLLSGVIIVVGLLLHLDARARARRSAYVMLRRMAVTALAHWRALVLEVGGLLLAGFAAGAAIASVVVLLTRPDYDVDAATAPGTVVDVPWVVLAALLGAALATGAVAAGTAQRAASRARPSEVLRDPH